MCSEKKLLVFDMDGTLVDFYGVNGWLEAIRAEKVDPYRDAKPLVDMKKLVSMLNKLKEAGAIDIAIVTWGAKESSKDFLKETRKAKKAWLDEYGFPYDTFHCIKYGSCKRYPVSATAEKNKGRIPESQILFDDNKEVREDWNKWNESVSHDKMLDYLAEMVRKVEKGNEINFHIPEAVKEKEELYMVLDCETATLPFVKQWDLTPKDKQKIAIAKPLIYDIGWRVIDKHKNIYSQHSFLIQETFFVPGVFNTAYYAWKRPLYMERYQKGKIKCVLWEQAIHLLEQDLAKVKYATAYNAMFDFKKAIPFTDQYMLHLYDPSYQEWEKTQMKLCKKILNSPPESNDCFDSENMELRGRLYPIADIWGLACERLINRDDYRMMCLKKGMISASGLYFKTSAEASFRYLANNVSFEEEHTALSDAEIETDILCKILEKGEIPQGIIYFPFKDLGDTVHFAISNKDKITKDMFLNIFKVINDRLEQLEEDNWYSDKKSPFQLSLEKKKNQLLTCFSHYLLKENLNGK